MEAKRLFIKRDVDGESQLFPSSGTPAVVGTFTYTAKRMGGAPSITATVYYPTPLDKSWTHEEYVELLGEKYYATSIPSSSKDNATLLYKHDITFASRREVLDNTLFFDVVSDNDEDTSGGDKYRSNQTNFTFGGDITEFVSRINSSMKYCGVPYSVVIDEGYASTDVKEVSFESQYLTEVLQLINTTYELDYYWVGSVCHIGKLQYDLTGEPVEYGRANALTSVSKDNSNAKIVDMITGYGSSDNIPYYYPNEDAYGAAVYETENFDKSLVAGVSLGKLLKWDNSIYGKTLTLCKNSSESYTGDIFGLSKYSVYVSDNVAWDEDMVSSGSGASSADIKATCSLGERIITGFGTRTSTMAVSSSVIWLFFEFNGQVGDTINLDGIEFSSTEASGSNHLGLELSHEKVFYVGEGMDMASALSAMRTAYVATIKGNGDKTYTNASGTASSNYWAFGDNIGTDFSEYTKSSDKVCTLTRSGKVTVVIGCKVCATNIIVAKGTGKMNTVTTSMTGSIICTHMPQSVYYFDNGEGGTLAYGDSGIEINGIESIPNKTLAFTFDGTDWVGSVDSSDSASKIRITGRTWISPSQNLMPSVYRSSNGSERFYYAKNDTYLLPDDSGKYYSFVNEYKSGNPHQGSVEFSDIKPTISGMRNDVIQADGLGQLFGEIADVAFDSNDSDATDSDGNYIHSYFYIKLHKFSGDYGFDLFSHALASDNAKINLVKSNGCPACSFDIQCTASKDNSKMYNCVSTDGAGNLKSVRTDYNDYIFKNDGDAYSDTFNQDSTTTELWIALKKEDSTLGIVMPNASGNFKPQKGDLFVITGIRPPKVLVTAAEKRLDDALIKYMSENNEDQFDYSIKFSRIFLQEHQDFANKLNENSKIAVRYAGETHEFYVSDYTVKVDDNALAEVTVELSETLETSSSELKATIDSVKGETVAQLQGLINGGGSFNATVADKLYLSKLSDDTAQGLITFLQGLVAKSVADLQKGATFGKDSFITELGHAVLNTIRSIDYNNAAEAGFSIEKDSMGRYQAFITNLTVWGKAVFNELEIRKLSYAGGNIYLSGAGSKIIKAVPVKKVTKTSTASDGTETVAVAWEPCEVMDDDCAGWKCYLLADDGTTATMNFWQEGDQARCRTMGEITSSASYENVSNRSFWRTIPDDGVSTFNEKIYGTKTETYTDADGNELTRETVVELYDGQMFAWIVIGKHALAFDGVTEGDPNTPDLQDAPQAGDTIVLDGNRHRGTDGAYDKKDRQNVITLETTGDYAPRIACYADITEYKHTVTKGGKEVSLSVFETSPSSGTKVNSSRFEWTSDDGSTVNIINYRGDWSSSSTYHKNDQVNHANAMWVCMADSGVDVTEEPSDTAVYWKKVLSGGKGEKGDDAVTYELVASPGYIKLNADGSIDYSNGYTDKEAPFSGHQYMTFRGYKIVGGKRIASWGTEEAPISVVFSINDGAAYYESTQRGISGTDDVYTDFRPDNSSSYGEIYDEIHNNGLRKAEAIMYEGENLDPDKIPSDKILARLDIPIVKDGADGTSYNVSLTVEKRTVSSVTEDCLVVTFSKSGADGVTTTENVQAIGGYAQVYVDGTLNDAMTSKLNNNSSDAGELMQSQYPAAFSASYVTVKWYDKEGGTLLGMGSLTRGADGEAAVTYEVQVSSYSEYVGSGRIYGLQFQFVKVTGATRQTVTDVREIGCVIAINTAAYIYTDAASYINEGSSHFLFSSYPVANVTMDEADNITVKMYLSTDTEKENPVAVANFANGKQGADGMGALEISVSPDTVIFDTDDNGLVSSSASKTATISCYRDGKKVENVEYALPSSGHPDCNATISTANSIATVTISGIATDATYGVSKTSGTVKVQVYDVDNGRYYYPTVKFAVNVAKFNGSMVANNKKFETVYNELTNNGSSTDLTWYESKIEQTARNISLKVQEKNVGRRNLLVGSAFRKQESGFCKIIGGYISINGGYEGTNCVRAVNQYSGTQYYYGVFWDGSQGGSSVKIERGKKYILSVWVKCDNVNATIALEPIFTDKQTSATRTSARPKQTKQYFKVTNANEWELLQSVIDTSLNQDGSTNTLYDCLAVNVWCSHALSGVTVNAWFCRPMLEEGEEYNGWTQSEQDYDYVGGNLLDNTGTLTESGNLATVNGTVTEGGMGESASIKRTLPTTASEIDPLAFSTSGMGIKAGEDYILSFYAKADSDTTAGKLQCFFHPSSGGIYTEDSAGGNDNSRNPSDGSLLYGIVPTTAWKRYWVHWRPTASDMQYVRFRVLPRGTSKGSYSSTTTYAVDDYVLYNGTYWRCKAATKGNAPTSSSSYWEATVYDVSIAQPKLEVGATMTEWTEKRADMVDKQALLATGIDIDNKIVTVTADKFRVQNNSGEQTALVTGDGKLTTSLIDADTVVAQGIKTQELEAQNLKVTGSSKFGIWSIGTDSKWGDVIQASDFTDLNGVTYVGSMMQYTPSFVRGGSSAGAYMRVGPYTAEFGQVVDNGYNGIWFGYAARIVCQGSANSWDLPTGYVYNTGYSPTAYIYSKGSGENPAFAINRANGGAAIQTNGAVRCRGFGGGVTTVSSSTTLDNNAYFVRCTNSSGITVTLPSDPVEGQTVIIVQAGGSVAISGGSKTIWARGQTGGTSSVTSGMTGQFNIFVYDGTQWNATMTNGTY